MVPYLWPIPLFPSLGALIIFVLARKITPRGAGIIACTAVGLSFAWVLLTSSSLLTAHSTRMSFHEILWHWLDAGTVQSNIGFLFDRISMAFCIVVAGVGWLIHLYSVAYMEGDEGTRRYFGYMNLFVASMLVLVMADNAFFMFMGWEGVGACSFFLIGHWYQKPQNTAAAQKAFLVTRVGDVFLIVGLLLCARIAGSGFADMSSFARFQGSVDTGLLTTAAVLLLLGATGKSAQLPLQVWLPDAMAGPTPVSALIHAATMVTAGVYLIARFHIVFALSPEVLQAVAVVGVATAFYGATCAIVQTDIKRILAYSTISQIGYMILGLGTGMFSLGIFHFFTHAFYKALLFLAAGVVIHALHGEQNIHNMGGLRRLLPGTWLVFLAGAASLAGIPLVTAGFFSKDAILWASLTTENGSPLLYAVGLFTALLTAVYTFRMIFIVFCGQPQKDVHIHAPAPLLRWPLAILALLALTAGYLNIPAAWHMVPVWEHFFAPVFKQFQSEPLVRSHAMETAAAAVSAVIAVGGLGIAWFLYAPGKPPLPETSGLAGEIENENRAPYRSALANFLFRGWNFDDRYETLFVRPFRFIASICRLVDKVFVDSAFELCGALVRGLHGLLLSFQNGRIARYAMVMLFGAIAICAVLIFLLPGVG